MASYQITCIVLAGGKFHQHITHLGTKIGLLPLATVIGLMRTGDDFYVSDFITGMPISVHVVNDIRVMHAYVQTQADGKWTNNLLSLPSCDGN